MEIEEKIRNQEIKEILKKTPPRLIRTGNLLVVVVILVILFLSIIVKYPDTVSGEIILTTPSPPAKLISRKSGRINFLKSEGDLVSKNDLIAYISNTAEISHIDQLSPVSYTHLTLPTTSRV